MSKKLETLEGMGYVLLPIGDIIKANWNYKGEDADKARKLTAQVKRNGILENSIVRELDGKYELVNGNHRHDTYVALGIKMVPCVNLGVITTAQAKRIAIETNETRFDSDPVKFHELMVELRDDFDIADIEGTLPFTLEEIESFAEPDLPSDFNEKERKSVDTLNTVQLHIGEFSHQIPRDEYDSFVKDRNKEGIYDKENITKWITKRLGFN